MSRRPSDGCRRMGSRSASRPIGADYAGISRYDEPGPIPPGADRPRILLADDNADMRDYVSRLLSERYDVTAVPDGMAALAVAQRPAAGPGPLRCDDAGGRRIRRPEGLRGRPGDRLDPRDPPLGPRGRGIPRRGARGRRRRLPRQALQRRELLGQGLRPPGAGPGPSHRRHARAGAPRRGRGHPREHHRRIPGAGPRLAAHLRQRRGRADLSRPAARRCSAGVYWELFPAYLGHPARGGIPAGRRASTSASSSRAITSPGAAGSRSRPTRRGTGASPSISATSPSGSMA